MLQGSLAYPCIPYQASSQSDIKEPTYRSGILHLSFESQCSEYEIDVKLNRPNGYIAQSTRRCYIYIYVQMCFLSQKALAKIFICENNRRTRYSGHDSTWACPSCSWNQSCARSSYDFGTRYNPDVNPNRVSERVREREREMRWCGIHTAKTAAFKGCNVPLQTSGVSLESLAAWASVARSF